MIDLTQARKVLEDTTELFEDLDGWDISDVEAVGSHGSRAAREERAQASKDMLLLVDRFALISQLVKDAYWEFKGEESALERGAAS